MFKKLNSWVMKLYVRHEIFKQEMKQTLNNQRGAGAVEYGLLIAVVVTMVIAAAAFMREPLEKFFKDIIGYVRGLFGI